MKRKEIIDSLIKEGFTEKTLCNLTDKQLLSLSERIIGEAVVKQVKVYSMKNPKDAEEINTIVNDPKKVADMSRQGHIQVTTEEKPSAGLSKEKKSEVVKKAKKGGDIGKKGKGFKEVEKKAKEAGADDPKAVAAAAMWKNIKRESEEVKEWVKSLSEQNFHGFTSKNEIMELIGNKLTEVEVGPNVKKGHNGIPEFMTYDAISKKDISEDETITKPKPKTTPTTKPGDKPKTPYQPGPGKNPKPKALKETNDANK